MNREELCAQLADGQRSVDEFFRQLPLADLFHALPEEWAPMDDLRHLNRSVSPLVAALRMPKLALLFRFGWNRSGSRTPREVEESYKAALAGGLVARGRFVPSPMGPGQGETEEYRIKTLDRWNSLGDDLLALLERWSEKALDRHRLPHPVLGLMTVREILYFTDFHNRFHLDRAGRRVEEARG